MPDAHVNFGVSVVATAPSPATSGTSLVLQTGDGSLMPATTASYNMTVWPAGSDPTSANSEIIRVTARSGDTLSTIVRAQEGTTARSIQVGDNIAVTITAKTLTDAENNTWDTVIKKAADESVASSTTLQNDDHLFFTGASGGAYEIEIVLIYASPAGGGTPDLKVALGEDGTSRGIFDQTCFNSSDTAFVGAFPSNNAAGGTYGTATTDRMVWIRGTHVSAGGTFRLTWAQGTSSSNATIVRAGSILRYRKLN